MLNRIIAGKYRVEEELGHGSMGHIWRAFDENLQRNVALKLMSSSLLKSATAKARFDREALAIAKLQSPHVVQIFDAGVDEGAPFIVMELLDGEDLQSRLERAGKLSIGSMRKLVDEVAKALTAAHAREFVHRDLKPANIFIAKDDALQETHKILDFGVVALLVDMNETEDDFRVTTAGTIVGTPLYMSPEQIRSSYIDRRSDLWSFGVVLYKALTGVVPFKATTVGALMVTICMDPHVAPSKLVDSLPPGVDDFFAKALAKDPDKRFQTAQEFAAAWNVMSSQSESRAAKILVVDDEPQVEKLFTMRFRKQLRQGQYQFVFAPDGERALGLLREHPEIDVVFTDINMPKMDGLTFLAHLGATNPFARAIVVSAYGDMRNIRTAMNRGAFDFLTKPVDFDDLEATAQKTLQLTAELRKNARFSAAYSELRKFVSPNLVRRIENLGSSSNIEGVEGTVVFMGISGSNILPNDPAAEQIRSLNANFEIIVPLIGRHGGMIHQFIGSTAVVVFQGENHLRRAIDTSLTVRENLQSMALKAGPSSPFALGVSIGISSGALLLAEIGSNAYERLDLAVLGEAWMIALRLQLSALKNQILVDANTSQLLDDADDFDLLPMEQNSSRLDFGAVEVIAHRNGLHTEPLIGDTTSINVEPLDDSASELQASGVRRQTSDDMPSSPVSSSG